MGASPRLLSRMDWEWRLSTEGVSPGRPPWATYRKFRTVAARRLTEPLAWTTDAGDVLHADIGDWLVTDGDKEWSVAADIFEQTYTRLPDGRYLKTAMIRAFQVDEITTVETLEGPATALAGDWIAENPSGEQWPIPAADFVATYELVEETRE